MELGRVYCSILSVNMDERRGTGRSLTRGSFPRRACLIKDSDLSFRGNARFDPGFRAGKFQLESEGRALVSQCLQSHRLPAIVCKRTRKRRGKGGGLGLKLFHRGAIKGGGCRIESTDATARHSRESVRSSPPGVSAARKFTPKF